MENKIEELIAVLQLEEQKDGFFHTSWGRKNHEGLVETIREILALKMKTEAERIAELEAEGLTTSDAQGVVMAEDMKKDLRVNCDNFEKCGNKADVNLQNNWQLYGCLPNGGYSEIKSWEGDSNEFFCENCYEKEMAITN